MAKSGRKSKDKGPPKPAPGNSSGMVKTILALTLFAVAVSFGLIAWNSQHSSDLDELKILQRDAMISGQRLNASADKTIDRLEQSLKSGQRLSRVDTGFAGVESLMSLDAARASNDERNVAIAAQAAAMLQLDQRLHLMEDGRLMLVHVPANGPAIIATVSPDKWLPPAVANERLILYGATVTSLGDKSVLPPDPSVLTKGQGFRYDGVLDRSATGCVAIGRADFSLCVSRPSPLLTTENGIQLALYLLLLAAPTLAVMGLYSTRSGKNTAPTTPLPTRQSADESTHRTAVENSYVGVWTLKPSQDAAWLSEEAAGLLGLQTGGTISATQMLEHIYAPHRQTLKDAVDRSRSGRPFSVSVGTAATRGESWIELRGSLDIASGAQTTSLSGVVFDVTESVRQRERRRNAEAMLRSAIEKFPCPFALWDEKKRLTFWNQSFEMVFGLDDILRAGVAHETVMIARSGNVVSERASEEESGTTMLGLRTGEWFKIVERATPAGGLITFGLDVTQDVKSEEMLTQQKKKLRNAIQELGRSEGHNAELARKYNEEKAKAERSADSKSAFLANMSHELRTPLNAINGFSEILVNEMYGPLGDKRYSEYARDILTSGQHLLDMINDILDIAKIEAGKMTIDPKPIDLVDPVDAAVRMIRRKAEDKGIQLSLQAEDMLPEVDADHRAVRQMVLNLLSNAIKFTDAGGRIIVAVQKKNDFLRVAVRDSGVGIPKEHLPRLAQPFEQVQETRERNYDGTGLGLALTKSFAEMHGGRFSIASEVGKGTMVSFFLPISTDLSRSDRNVA